ncbi:hypothetical protein EB118_12715 [bacterium]|nr:hypothetical protein [bacterium]
MSNPILADRIKELSYTVGTGNFHLNGAAQGFSSFSSQYNYNDYLLYAATDGTRYEIGSGQYILDGINNALRRFPFRSSNSNQIINFPAGLKEIYVTYPATHSVYTGSGISNLNFPQKSGVAVWSSSNILNYDNNIVWDSDNKRLGIINQNPEYGIHVGGNGQQSSVFASGFYVGTSGIYFPSGNNGDSGYQGGRQLAHFVPNELGDANIQAVLELSGVIDNIFFFKKQNAGLVFAGPPSGCSPPCSPAYPSFRPLVINDIEDLVDVSGLINTHVHGNISNSGTIGSTSGLMVVTGSGGYIQTSVLPAPYFKTITNYNDTGTSGQMTFDSDYVYFNVPSGDSPTGLVWKRAAISIWG